MTRLQSTIENEIIGHSLAELPVEDDWVMPYYQGLSLLNLPGTICDLLGTRSYGQPSLDVRVSDMLGGPYQKVIVFLIDAMGYALFNRMLQASELSVWSDYLDRAVYCPLTSTCPSTTASALTTLWTGAAPAAHGIIGYEMWAKEFGMVINNILHTAASTRCDVGGLEKAGFDPNKFLNMPVLGSHLHKSEIKSTAFMPVSIAYSGLSTMQMGDVQVRPFVNEADLCVSLLEHLNKNPGVREFIYIYYSDVDTLIHRYGPADRRIPMQFQALSVMFRQTVLNKLSQQAARDTMLILTADHGAEATPKRDQYILSNHPKLLDCLVMQPTCENRLAFLYIKPGRVGEVRDYFMKTWPDQFTLLDPDQALEAGLFGPGLNKPQTRERLGDLIAAAKGDSYLWWASKHNLMLGRHGGLNRNEMLVPFYALPLGDVIRN